MLKIHSKDMLLIKPTEKVLASAEALDVPLQVGDTLKINDGMGRTNFNYTGFPSDTVEQGDFTLTSTIKKIQEDEDGNTIYRASFKIPKNNAKIIIDKDDANVLVYGNGARVNVSVSASEDDAEITTDAGLTKSNSIYEGDYTIVGKIEPLPDTQSKLEIGGQLVNFDDLPNVFIKDNLFAYIVKKDGKLRNYISFPLIQNVNDMLARSLSFNITPVEAIPTINYVITTDQNVFTQTNGTAYGYKGDTLTYEITADGFKTISGTYDFSSINKIVDVEMEQVTEFGEVYSNIENVQVGDDVILNSGVGENAYKWTANNIGDAEYTGNFTLIADVEELLGNNLIKVNSTTIEDFELNITTAEDNAQITTMGDIDNAIVDLVVNQDNATITSKAGIETVESSIVGNRILHAESLTGYDVKLQLGGQNLETGKHYLVEDGQVLSCLLKYNGNLASYIQFPISKDVEFKKHTFTIVPSVSGATVKMYGQETNGINCYSGQTIQYEVSYNGQTILGTYLVPQNSSSNMNYSLDVEL